jgi:large subunit ribosomal protein L9
MKVILLKDVRGVGGVRDVKNVADGYAINFLFPNKFAEPATEEKVAQLEAQKQAHAVELKKQEEDLVKNVQSLGGVTISMAMRATEKGGLFKSVTAKEISKAILEQHGIEIPESAVKLSEPIKTVGEHILELNAPNTKSSFGVAITSL